jgi:hypothetical protein
MTAFVETDAGKITDTAPIWKAFIGQPLENLVKWLGPEAKYKRLDEDEEAKPVTPNTPIRADELPPAKTASELEEEKTKRYKQNMRYWRQLQHTPKEATKDRDMPWGRITTINPHWQKLRMTEVFGPVGNGWGHSLVKSETLEVDGGLLREVTVRVWVNFEDCSGEWHAVGSDFYKRSGKPRVDKDAGKKAYTDALTKAFSDIGLSADIFLSDLGNFETPYDDEHQGTGRRDVRPPARRPQPRRQPQRSSDNQEQELWARYEQKFRDWYFAALKSWGNAGYEWKQFTHILENCLSGKRLRRREADGWKLVTRDLTIDDFKAMSEAKDKIEGLIRDALVEQEG